jgi:hypothetical protein
VDWIYRDLERVRHWIDLALDGRVEFHYQPGHPFAFGTHSYLGEVAVCRVLADRTGLIDGLKALTLPYPHLLRKRLLGTIWEAGFSLDIAEKAAMRGDVAYVAGCVFRCCAVLAQVLFALNERYWLNEKGALVAVGAFPLRPPAFVEVVQAAVGNPGRTPEALVHTLQRMESVVSDVERLCEGQND